MKNKKLIEIEVNQFKQLVLLTGNKVDLYSEINEKFTMGNMLHNEILSI